MVVIFVVTIKTISPLILTPGDGAVSADYMGDDVFSDDVGILNLNEKATFCEAANQTADDVDIKVS